VTARCAFRGRVIPSRWLGLPFTAHLGDVEASRTCDVLHSADCAAQYFPLTASGMIAISGLFGAGLVLSLQRNRSRKVALKVFAAAEIFVVVALIFLNLV
jgi:hypothetical protein